MGYDPKCYELAMAFLEDHPDLSKDRGGELAQEIQDTIETFLDEWVNARKDGG